MEAKQPVKRKSHAPLNVAVQNINKLYEAGGITTSSSSQAVSLKPESESVTLLKTKNARTLKHRIYRDRGVVYLAHIPHGFYESEMKRFFSQFGHVTRLRLVRSHKTGNSRGYAFLEFRFSEVAQVVAETMNNYLMRNRLLKATFIPPEKVTPKMFFHSKNYGPETCIGLKNRRKALNNQNKGLPADKAQVRVDRTKQHLVKLQEKLKAQGVDCLFQVDEGTSDMLTDQERNSRPALKKARSNSSTSKTAGSKSSGPAKPSNLASVSKKQTNTSKGQHALKSVKSVKNVKSGDKSASKIALKTEKKKVVGQKADKKKVVKKNPVKVGASKKDAAKKPVPKKSLAKKK